MTNQLPKKDIYTNIIFSKLNKSFEFKFDANDSLISSIIYIISKDYFLSLKKFLIEIIQFFIPIIKNEYIYFIGDDLIANGLYFFSKFSNSLKLLLLGDCNEKDSLNSIIESAVFETELKYGNLINSNLINYFFNFLNKFINQNENFEEIIFEIENLFGSKSKLFFECMISLTKLNSICSRYELSKHSKKLIQCSNFFGRSINYNNIKTRKPFINKYLENFPFNTLLSIEFNSINSKITINSFYK